MGQHVEFTNAYEFINASHSKQPTSNTNVHDECLPFSRAICQLNFPLAMSLEFSIQHIWHFCQMINKTVMGVVWDEYHKCHLYVNIETIARSRTRSMLCVECRCDKHHLGVEPIIGATIIKMINGSNILHILTSWYTLEILKHIPFYTYCTFERIGVYDRFYALTICLSMGLVGITLLRSNKIDE